MSDPASSAHPDGTPRRLGRYRLVRPISTGGMARVFAYLMSDEDVDMSDAAIFEDTSQLIRKALAKVKESHPDATHFTAKAFERALGFLM